MAVQADGAAEHPPNATLLAKVVWCMTTAGVERTRLFDFQIYLININ
jgi:hypothetical protein